MFEGLGTIEKEEIGVDYTIYDYLSKGALVLHNNFLSPPLDIDYNTDVLPRFYKGFSFGANGLLNTTVVSVYDFEQNQIIENILEITENYVLANDAPYPSQKTVVSRDKSRKWYKKNGQIDEENTKNTKKVYDTTKKRNDEGQRRRNNIMQNTAQGTVYSLVVLYYMGVLGQDQATATANAQDWVTELLHSVNIEYNDFIITGKKLPDTVNVLSNPLLNTEMDIMIPDIPEMYGDVYAQRGIGKTVREYLVESFKGNI